MATQIPEAISYAYIAGIDPFMALQSTWIMNVTTAIIGGRPGMLSSASGFGAITIRHLVRNNGTQYIYYSVILSGLLQVAFSTLKIGQYLRIMPPAITIGLLNAMCLLLYSLQLRYFKDVPMGGTSTQDEDNLNMPWAYYYGYDLPWTNSFSQVIVIIVEALVALLICFFLPRFVTVVPNTLVALVVLTGANIGITMSTDWNAPTIGDYCNTEVRCERWCQSFNFIHAKLILGCFFSTASHVQNLQRNFFLESIRSTESLYLGHDIGSHSGRCIAVLRLSLGDNGSNQRGGQVHKQRLRTGPRFLRTGIRKLHLGLHGWHGRDWNGTPIASQFEMWWCLLD